MGVPHSGTSIPNSGFSAIRKEKKPDYNLLIPLCFVALLILAFFALLFVFDIFA